MDVGDDPQYPRPPATQPEYFPTSAALASEDYDDPMRAERFEYDLIVRQEPKQARMCGVGGKADRRPIDPPPIVQLRVIDKRKKSKSKDAHTADDQLDPDAADEDDDPMAHSYLQNPYYFMFASLAKPDDEVELHWLKDGKTRCTTGSVVSSLYHLKDPHSNNEDAGFFVFPDLSVRTEGSYRLKLSLFEVIGTNVRHCKSIFSAPFYVYTAKKFPGMEESTPLSCSLADQGIKIRIRKDVRVRKRTVQGLEAPIGALSSQGGHDGQESGSQQPKRKKARVDDQSASASTAVGISSAVPMPQSNMDVIDPSLGGNTAGHPGYNASGVPPPVAINWGTPPASTPGYPATMPVAAPAVPPPGAVWPPAASLDPALAPAIPPPQGATRETVPPEGAGSNGNGPEGRKGKGKKKGDKGKDKNGAGDKDKDKDSDKSSSGDAQSRRETPISAGPSGSYNPAGYEYRAQTEYPPPPPYGGATPAASSQAGPSTGGGAPQSTTYGPPPPHPHPPHPYPHPAYGYPHPLAPPPPPHLGHAPPPHHGAPAPHWGIHPSYPPVDHYGHPYYGQYRPPMPQAAGPGGYDYQAMPPPPGVPGIPGGGYPPAAGYPYGYPAGGWGMPPPPPMGYHPQHQPQQPPQQQQQTAGDRGNNSDGNNIQPPIDPAISSSSNTGTASGVQTNVPNGQAAQQQQQVRSPVSEDSQQRGDPAWDSRWTSAPAGTSAPGQFFGPTGSADQQQQQPGMVGHQVASQGVDWGTPPTPAGPKSAGPSSHLPPAPWSGNGETAAGIKLAPIRLSEDGDGRGGGLGGEDSHSGRNGRKELSIGRLVERRESV